METSAIVQMANNGSKKIELGKSGQILDTFGERTGKIG